jgi:plastocyanin
MAKIPVLDAIRIIPRESDFLDRRSGSRGEIYVDSDIGTLRLYNGEVGGTNLLKDDLSNISSAALNKNVNFGTGTVTATQFIGAGIGAVLGDTPPTAAAGTLWFNTSTGKLYIYYNDGNSLQWVQPMTPSVGGGAGGGGASNLDGLTDVTITTPTAGQVLKYNGSSWTNDVDATSGGGGSGGTVTSVSVTSANGFAGTVATASSTPVITITTSITGLLKGGSSAISAAVAGTDYQAPITLTTIGSSGAATFTSGTLNIPQYSGGGSTALSSVTEVYTAGLTVDQFYLPAITRLNVTANGSVAYRFDQYGTTDDPTIYAINATTIAFNLSGAAGHPFLIQDNTGTNYSTGLVHVATDGVVSTGSNAQAKSSGTLYWKIPDSISGNYRYQCSSHGPMVGTIVVKNFATL